MKKIRLSPVLCSFFFMGLGQIVKGDYLKALLMYALTFLSLYLGVLFLSDVYFICPPIIYGWSLIDSAKEKKSTKETSGII